MQNTTTSTQVDFFEKKIEELEAQRMDWESRLNGASLRHARTCYLYLDAIKKELDYCRRSLVQLTGDES